MQVTPFPRGLQDRAISTVIPGRIWEVSLHGSGSLERKKKKNMMMMMMMMTMTNDDDDDDDNFCPSVSMKNKAVFTLHLQYYNQTKYN